MDEDMLPNSCHPKHCNTVDRHFCLRARPKRFRGKLGVVLTLVIFLCWSIGRPNEATADEASDKNHAANRVLLQKCVSCHGSEKQEGGLRLDSKEAAIHGGDRGPSIVPGDLDKSLLIRAIRFDDPDLQMPPKQKLSDAEIEVLTDWVKAAGRQRAFR